LCTDCTLELLGSIELITNFFLELTVPIAYLPTMTNDWFVPDQRSKKLFAVRIFCK